MRDLAFSTEGTRAPLAYAAIEFPGLTDLSLDVVFLVDTGAWEVTLGPRDATRLRDQLGVDLTALPRVDEGLVGFGAVPCYLADGIAVVQSRRFPVPVKIQEPHVEGGRNTPSLLGRQILTAFTLIVAWPTNELYLR